MFAAGASAERTETIWNNLNPTYGRIIEFSWDPDDGEVRSLHPTDIFIFIGGGAR